jgi:hypothetical protein
LDEFLEKKTLQKPSSTFSLNHLQIAILEECSKSLSSASFVLVEPVKAANWAFAHFTPKSLT